MRIQRNLWWTAVKGCFVSHAKSVVIWCGVFAKIIGAMLYRLKLDLITAVDRLAVEVVSLSAYFLL